MNEKFFSLPEEKQRTIINAGYRVFSQNSYKNSPMSEIAQAAGISKSLLFHYFHNKKELYFIPMMYRDMYWASEGYLWEMVQRGDVDMAQMEEDFTKLIEFWKSIYLRKE